MVYLVKLMISRRGLYIGTIYFLYGLIDNAYVTLCRLVICTKSVKLKLYPFQDPASTCAWAVKVSKLCHFSA